MELKNLNGMRINVLGYHINPFDKNGIAVDIGVNIAKKVYFFLENEDDGYRSRMCPVLFSEGALYSFCEVQGYIREPMTLKHKSKSTKFESHGEDDVLEFISDIDGHVWLAVGTEDIDDYYPSFVMRWNPRIPS